MKNNKYLNLFLSFLKIGAFTFGSGYAMITLLQKEIVEKHHWMTDEEVLEMIAVAESTPGSITVCGSAFVGYKIAGLLGAIIATIGVILPSLIIIISVSHILTEFSGNIYVQRAFNGIRIAILALIIKAMVSLFQQIPKRYFSYIMIAFALITVGILNINGLYIIICCALIGVAYHIYFYRRGKRR